MKRFPFAMLASSLAVLVVSHPGISAGVSLVPGSILSRTDNDAGIVLGGPVHIHADTLAYEEDTGVATADGNVELSFGNRTIRAERIRYDSRSGEADLVGRVRYKDGGDEFSFERIVVNLDNATGVLYNGTILLSANNYRISSERFEKTGDRSFRVQKGTLTTCPCDPEPDWKFEVRRSQVTIDGYAVGKDVTFKVRGVPVLWLPWAAFPVKLSRQSGFLMPGFSSGGTKGATIQLPFYWAISRWSDATATLDWMSRRGFRPEVEYRYVPNPESEGVARLTTFHDKEIRRDRFRAYGSNLYRDGERFTANAKWDVASDDAYYVDLVDADVLRTGRHVPSRGFAGRDGSFGSQALSAVWVQDLQGTPDDNTVQRLPEAVATLLPHELGKTGIEVAGEIYGTYFYRREGDREARGRGYSEISRTFTLYPSVSGTPFLSLDILGSIPASEGATEKGGRIVPGGGVRMEADFRRDFERGTARRYLHLIQPNLSFRWVPPVDQDRIPVTDQWSRIGPQTQLTFSVDQRILRIAEGAGPFELASLSLEWALELGGEKPSTGSPYLDPLSPYVRALRDQIDLAVGRVGRERQAASDLFARFRIRPAERWNLNGEILYGFSDRAFTAAAAGAEWRKDRENHLLFEYRTSRDLSEDIHGLAAFRPFSLVGFRNEANYSLKNGELTDGSVTLTIYPRSECWSIGVTGEKRSKPVETSYKLFFTLKGIGTLGN